MGRVACRAELSKEKVCRRTVLSTRTSDTVRLFLRQDLALHRTGVDGCLRVFVGLDMPLFSPSRILRAAARPRNGIKWSETLNLPRSDFPARPSPAQLDEYRKRCADDLYVWQRANRQSHKEDGGGAEVRNEFVLHDGPPYANGAVHVGHALNKILKDLVLRWHLSTGKRVHYRPGWDCHGLPIELKALQAQETKTQQVDALRDAPKQEEAAASGVGMSATEIRSAARELATQTVETQKKSFREWGVMGEWDEPYTTMDPQFELGQLGVFREMVRRGLVSRRHRPVYWSPSSRTALAEAELEYDDEHQCTAAFVKMPLVRLPKVLASHASLAPSNVSALIWTTTPWTLPANMAVAVNPDLEYTLISLDHSSPTAGRNEKLLIAKDRVQHVLSFLPAGTTTTTVVETLSGAQLADGEATCFNMFSGSESPFLQAEYVTDTSGTGLVHTAPGHGMEDYQLCEESGVGPALAPVDDEGRFTADAFSRGGNSAQLAGLPIDTEGADAVLRILADPKHYLPAGLHQSGSSLVLAAHSFIHKNPIDWRTKKPVIVRATAQWFADVSIIKDRALRALDGVGFVPESGKTRLRSFIEGRSQWCISRQRAWGVPIPALYHNETGEACISQDSINHIMQVIRDRGTDAWFSDPSDDPAWLHSSLQPGNWTRGKDTMDVWFDSGTTWTILNEKHADVYLEGTDQHRGWFQSSLLTAISTQDSAETPNAPFAALITHGFTLDAEGRKMSKSIGNVISPEQIMNGSLLPPLKARKQRGKNKSADTQAVNAAHYDAMGPDVLRLWVASSDYTRDVAISMPVLQSMQQALQKYRVTFKFLLGVLGDNDPYDHSHERTFADEAVLLRLDATSRAVYDAYSEYKFHRAVTEINNFVNADLSAFYFEIIKDTMYTGSERSRRRAQDALVQIFEGLTQMLAPICPHLIEEVWHFMPKSVKDHSVKYPFHQIWQRPAGPDSEATAIEEQLSAFKQLSAAVKLAQEEARKAGKLRSGLACEVDVYLPPASNLGEYVRGWHDDGELADLLVVSRASLSSGPGKAGQADAAEWKYSQPIEGGEGAVVTVSSPTRHKCVRCWKFTAEEVDGACERCIEVVKEKGFAGM